MSGSVLHISVYLTNFGVAGLKPNARFYPRVTKRRNYLSLRAHDSGLRVQIPIGCSRICQLAKRRGLLFYGYPNCSLERATIQDLFTNNAFTTQTYRLNRTQAP